MTTALLSLPIFRAFDSAGLPLAGGLLYSYAANTLTPQNTYSDAAGTSPNTNPVVLDSTGSAVVRLDPTLVYKFVLKTSAGTTLWTTDYYQADNLTQASLVSVLGADPITRQTAGEIAASITPSNYAYPPGDIRRYGALMDNSTNDTTAFTSAISVCSQTVHGAVGNSVKFGDGTSILLSEVTLPNDVRYVGTNKNGSILKASASWNSGTSPYMLHAVNGTSSMFDSLLEYVTVDCNDIAGLGAIQSDAWQENSGPRKALIYRFRTYGILYSQSGYSTSGGAAFNKVEDTEIFSSTSGATAGIKVEQVSSVGSFIFNAKNCTIAGLPGGPALPKGIWIVKDSSLIESVHFENCTSGVYIDGVGSHTLINVTGDSNTTNLVEIASTFTGTIRMIGCRRAGATNWLKDNRTGGLGTITSQDINDLTIGTTDRGLSADNTVKAWCVFDGTLTGTNAPTKGFNVTSVTRNSAGDYTVTFTNALSNVNAVLHVGTALDTTDGWWAANKGFGLGSANFTVRRGGASAGAKVDSSPIEVLVIGFGT